MIWRLSLVERQCVMMGCRFDFTVLLFHRPKMDLKGILLFTLLHIFQFNQPQWKRQNQTKQPNKQRGNMLNIVAGTMLCFSKCPTTTNPPSLCVLNALAVITYALILSIHILNTWRCFHCLLSPQALINSFQTIFFFSTKYRNFVGHIKVCS